MSTAAPQRTEALDIADLEEVVAQRSAMPVAPEPFEVSSFETPQSCSDPGEHMRLGAVGDVCTESAISQVVPKYRRGLPFDHTVPAFAHRAGGNVRAGIERLVQRFPWLRRVGDAANVAGPRVVHAIAKMIAAVRHSQAWAKARSVLEKRKLPKYHELD